VSELQSVIEHHAAATTHRERSHLENEILKFLPRGLTKTKAAPWVSQQLRITTYEFDKRRRLFIAGSAADALWERVESGMALGTAVSILTKARTRVGKRPAALRTGIVEELARHDKLPPDAVRRSVAEAAQERWATEREFWAFIRRNILEYVDQHLAETGEMERERLWSDFERDLEALVKSHQHRWYRAKRAVTETQQHVSRAALRRALQVLHMDMPRKDEDWGSFRQKARRQERSLARLYHPDARGSDETRAQFEAVIQAYNVVERWIQEKQQDQPGTPLRVVQGGKQE
jgi:hypothetical protein